MLQTAAVHVPSDQQYAELEALIASRVADASGPLFTTNATGLFDAYLAGMPEDFRQHYNCHCCRRFITNYGGLVTIDDSGKATPFLWNPPAPPDFFNLSVSKMDLIVRRAKVTGVFINGEKTWGTPFNVPGPPSKFQGTRWTHLHGTPPTVFGTAVKNASQAMAEKLQDYITLRKGLEDYSLDSAVQAVRVLEADAVDRSEKTLGVGKWLLDLHRAIEGVRGPSRDNLIWLAVAKAPPGWCHIRSTMISTLLDDIVAGLPFDSIKSRWDAKMHPLRYQRPTTVKQGNLEQANKIVAKLESEGALERRFARLEEVTALWTPVAIEAPQAKRTGGAFDHLKARSGAVKPVDLPAAKVTWDKFRATVLPDAAEIAVSIGSYSYPFFGMVTAVNADAPPILQWDGLDGLPRNPVSWYFYHGGSSPSEWGLIPGWIKVNAVCLKPCQWQSDKFVHQGSDVFFVLDGARDMRHDRGAGFFPECLRSEYHEIRHAMEAYSRNAQIVGRDEGSANGISLGTGLTLRVNGKGGGTQDYSLVP